MAKALILYNHGIWQPVAVMQFYSLDVDWQSDVCRCVSRGSFPCFYFPCCRVWKISSILIGMQDCFAIASATENVYLFGRKAFSSKQHQSMSLFPGASFGGYMTLVYTLKKV